MVLGENKKLKGAVSRQQEIGKLLESEEGKYVEIYFYNGVCFTVIFGFFHQNKVEITLL